MVRVELPPQLEGEDSVTYAQRVVYWAKQQESIAAQEALEPWERLERQLIRFRNLIGSVIDKIPNVKALRLGGRADIWAVKGKNVCPQSYTAGTGYLAEQLSEEWDKLAGDATRTLKELMPDALINSAVTRLKPPEGQ